MDYQARCKSHYKMHCFSCNNPINRGDLITQCAEGGGMELRVVHFDNDTGFVPFTGSRWIHFDCEPWGVWTMAKAYFRMDDGEEVYPYPSVRCQGELAATSIQRIWRGIHLQESSSSGPQAERTTQKRVQGKRF